MRILYIIQVLRAAHICSFLWKSRTLLCLLCCQEHTRTEGALASVSTSNNEFTRDAACQEAAFVIKQAHAKPLCSRKPHLSLVVTAGNTRGTQNTLLAWVLVPKHRVSVHLCLFLCKLARIRVVCVCFCARGKERMMERKGGSLLCSVSL